ncbi:MAG: hypothetical protein ACI4GO_09615, partial [Hominenteromicrobium sp.]
SQTYMFDHDFDPECHNWGISLHAYEMVSPELVSISDVLKTCRALRIPLWMGETGGRNEHAWQTTMYEILAEYHAGYNLWCWKTVEGAGCASVLNFKVPEEWHLITDYALCGGPRPSFEHAQRIWDEYLECLKVEHCRENVQYHPYLLREGDFEIPAIGYDALPLDSHNGLADMPCATNYRVFDRFEIVYEQGYHPPMMPGGFGGPQLHPRDHMHLRLSQGEFASYTVRSKGSYTVGATYCAAESVGVRVMRDGQILFEGMLPAAAETPVHAPSGLFPHEGAANALAPFTFGTVAGAGVIRLEVTQGTAEFGEIVLREVK